MTTINNSTHEVSIPTFGVDDHATAKFLGVSVSTIRKDRYSSNPRIPFFTIGDRSLYNLNRVAEAMIALERGADQLKHTKKTNAQK